MIECKQKFGMRFFLDSSTYKHSSVHIRHVYENVAKNMDRNDKDGKRDGHKLREGPVIQERSRIMGSWDGVIKEL